MRKSRTLDREYFEALYRRRADPWDFETSPYEREKYRDTLAALGGEKAEYALEVGCSIGVLTAALSECCDHLTATDVSEIALSAARERCADRPNVAFRLVARPMDNLVGRFDLIILSEVIYYWDESDLCAFAARLDDALNVGGRLLLVPWLGETDYPLSADDAVAILSAHLQQPLVIEQQTRTADYRLDLWRKHPRDALDTSYRPPVRS